MSYTGLKNVNRKNEEHLIPDHIYYDLVVTNNNLVNASVAPSLQFNEIRSTTFLQNPSDYYLSIVRFQVDTTSLPLFIPQVDTTQINSNQLIYSITLSYGINSFTAPLIFVPQDLSQTAPTAPFNDDTYTNPYYYIYNIQSFIFNTVNVAFQTALTGLLALDPSAPSIIAPFIEFDPFTNYCILNADILGYGQIVSLPPPMSIFFNANLYQLFNSFPATFQGFTNLNKAYQIRTANINNTNILNLPTYNAIQMYQEFSTIPVWNPIKSFIFTTNLLPVNSSLESDPIVFGNNNQQEDATTNNALANVLTDYQVELVKGNETRPIIQYVPSAEYRLFDLVGNNPLGTINLQCFWKDRFNNLVPFQLRTGCSASIKIMFRNKKYSNQ